MKSVVHFESDLSVKYFIIVCLLLHLLIVIPVISGQECDPSSLAGRVNAYLDHLNSDKEGLPGVKLSDSLPIPDFISVDETAEAEFRNCHLRGLQSFFISSALLNLVQMTLDVNFTFPFLSVDGDYSLRVYKWSLRGKGDFQMNVTAAVISIGLRLDASPDGQPRMNDVHVDVTIESLKLHFFGLTGFLAGLGNTIINAIGPSIFQKVKPKLIHLIRSSVMTKSTVALTQIPPHRYLVGPLYPLDVALERATVEMKASGYDPYRLPSHFKTFEWSMLGFTVNGSFHLHSGSVSGLTSLHRTDVVSVSYVNGSVKGEVNLGFDRLDGEYQWTASLFGLSTSGGVYIRVESVELRLILAINSLKPEILSTNVIDVRQITTDVDGLGSLDFLLEFLSNFVSNIFKYQLSELVETELTDLLRQKLQSIKLPIDENCY